MPIKREEIEVMLTANFPNASISITDMAGDENHYQVIITSEKFIGKSRVQQHQMVYTALGEKIGNELHALALTTRIPE